MTNDLAGNQELTECAHPLCACTLMSPMREETYCSDACRNADDGGIENAACDCAHPQCDAPQ
ncbi:MAG: hypothetical protein M3R51_09290 [Candidatus Eremiobacteraeota bacterium]|nr:hypothetical protein [Candidatus Eremiobacteraeota bacterium]